MKYKVESCVGDSCIKNEKDEIVLIVNSRANALTICEILNLDENHENGILAPVVWESIKFKQTRKETIREILNIIDTEIKKGIEYCKDDYRGLLTARVLIQLFYREHFGVEIGE